MMSRKKKKKQQPGLVEVSGRFARRSSRTKSAPSRKIKKVVENRRKGRIRALVNKCF